MNVLAYLVAAPVSRQEIPLEKWLPSLESSPFTGSVERAVWGGFHADRLGYAFVAGYSAAMRRLVDAPYASVCATESGGNQPSAIQTRLDKEGGHLLLRGEKTFATMAPLAKDLLVVASRGVGTDGRNRLRIARVPANTKGVVITPREPTPFTPEIPHARVRFDDVIVEDRDVLPIDGYAQFLKPFRTLEDIHVLASAVGYLAGAARTHAFSRDVLAECVSTSLTLIDLAARDPLAPLTHAALAGVFATAKRLFDTSEWQKANPEERDRFTRDIPLLQVANFAREKRTERAFAELK